MRFILILSVLCNLSMAVQCHLQLGSDGHEEIFIQEIMQSNFLALTRNRTSLLLNGRRVPVFFEPDHSLPERKPTFQMHLKVTTPTEALETFREILNWLEWAEGTTMDVEVGLANGISQPAWQFTFGEISSLSTQVLKGRIYDSKADAVLLEKVRLAVEILSARSSEYILNIFADEGQNERVRCENLVRALVYLGKLRIE